MAMLPTKTLEENVWTMACERTEKAFQLFDRIIVSFSGGKDSTACLQVAIEVARKLDRLPLEVIHYDEEAIPYQTEEYVRRVSQWPDVDLKWYCLPVKHRNGCSRKSPYWYPWAPEDEAIWVRPMPPEGISEAPFFPTEPSGRMTIPTLPTVQFSPKDGTVGLVMGIRASESLTRHRAVIRREADNYIIPYAGAESYVTKVYPIYDWKTPDVWTAPAKFGWDYNRAYDVMEQCGLSRENQRCSPAYGEEPLQKLWTYSVCFPEIWDAMSVRVPGAATAARYALTELYSYGKKLEKPDGVSWEEYITHYIQKFPEAQQRQIAKRIRQEIRAHYKKTRDPILDKARHPETGISWGFLFQIASRGDLKNRKQAGSGIHPDKAPALWEKYRAERKESGL